MTCVAITMGGEGVACACTGWARRPHRDSEPIWHLSESSTMNQQFYASRHQNLHTEASVALDAMPHHAGLMFGQNAQEAYATRLGPGMRRVHVCDTGPTYFHSPRSCCVGTLTCIKVARPPEGIIYLRYPHKSRQCPSTRQPHGDFQLHVHLCSRAPDAVVHALLCHK